MRRRLPAGGGVAAPTRCWAGALALGLALQAGAAVEVVGRVTHPALAEISGLAKSERGDFYWTHNDSGDSPRLFAIDAEGTPLWPAWRRLAFAEWQGHAIANAAHFDWEAVALHAGVLYIADVGNNGNARRDLGVYVVHEPDPLAVDKMRALRFLPVRYPDQKEHPGAVWHFDCESVFVDGGKLHFITKHRQSKRIDRPERGAKLYRLDTAHTDRQNALTLVGQHDGILWATDAALSADGARLVVASMDALWMFERPAAQGDWFSGKAWKQALEARVVKQLEAIAWIDAQTLLLINEQRDVMRANVADFLPVE